MTDILGHYKPFTASSDGNSIIAFIVLGGLPRSRAPVIPDGEASNKEQKLRTSCGFFIPGALWQASLPRYPETKNALVKDGGTSAF